MDPYRIDRLGGTLVSRFSSYVVAWADPHARAPGEPVIERLRAAAQSQRGALLACGGAQDVVETDSRLVPVGDRRLW